MIKKIYIDYVSISEHSSSDFILRQFQNKAATIFISELMTTNERSAIFQL